jgi:O-antigen/teichoic acid export membrane protein
MTSHSARWRIWGALAGNVFARAIRAVEQFLLIPILLTVWGTEQYGEWMVLISIAAFATIANLGIGQAALSDIVLCYANGDREQAARAFATSIILITAVVAVGFLLLAVAVHVVDVGAFVTLQSITSAEANTVIQVAGLAALLAFYIEPFIGVIGSAIGAAMPNVLFAIAKIFELIGVVIALRLSAGPAGVAVVMLAAAVLNLSMNALVAMRVAPWIRVRLKDFDVGLLTRAWKASLGFFVLWLCVNLVSVHVSRLMVFQFFGASALAAFTVLATYTRAARMVPTMLSQATQVEIGRAYGERRYQQFRNLVEAVMAAAAVVAVALLMVELLIAPVVIPLLTRGQFGVDWHLLIMLALIALVGAYFDAVMVAAASLNRVARIAAFYAAALAVGFLAAALLRHWLGLWAIGVALLLPELAGAWSAVRTVRRSMPAPAIQVFPPPTRISQLLGGR